MTVKGRIGLENLVKKHVLKLSELCFYVFFVSLLFAKGIGLYDGQTIFKVFLIIALIGWVGKVALTGYTVREMLIYSVLLILGGVVYLISREKGALFIVLLLCGLKNINTKKLFQVGTVTWILSFGVLFFLTALHIVNSPFKVHDRLGMGRVIRWSLGYAHPNVLHISYLVFVCFLVYLLQEKFRFYYLLLLELGNLFVFMYSLSTTGFLVTTICLALVCYWNIRKQFNKVEQGLIQLCLPICLFLSFGAPLLLKGRLFDIVNKFLNTRLELSKWFLTNQPVRLLGRDTTSIVTSLRTMDNSYVFAWITYGALFFFVVMYVYFRGIYRKTMQQDGIALCVILSCLIAGLTEPFLFNTSFKNLSFLFVGSEFLYRERGGREIAVGSRYDRNVEIPLPDMSGFWAGVKGNVKRNWGRLMVIAFVGALAGAVLAFCCIDYPDRYILPRKTFEYTDDLVEGYYLMSEEDILQEGDRVLGYESEQTEMVVFSGNIAKLEKFRNTVTSSIVMGGVAFLMGSLAILLQARSRKGIRKNGS